MKLPLLAELLPGFPHAERGRLHVTGHAPAARAEEKAERGRFLEALTAHLATHLPLLANLSPAKPKANGGAISSQPPPDPTVRGGSTRRVEPHGRQQAPDQAKTSTTHDAQKKVEPPPPPQPQSAPPRPAALAQPAPPPPAADPAPRASVPTPLLPLPAPAQAVSGAVHLRSAHLAIEQPDGVSLGLHLRVREGVADVRVEAPQPAQLAAHISDLRVSLASEGLALGQFDLNSGHAPPQQDGDDRATARPSNRARPPSGSHRLETGIHIKA